MQRDERADGRVFQKVPGAVRVADRKPHAVKRGAQVSGERKGHARPP